MSTPSRTPCESLPPLRGRKKKVSSIKVSLHNNREKTKANGMKKGGQAALPKRNGWAAVFVFRFLSCISQHSSHSPTSAPRCCCLLWSLLFVASPFVAVAGTCGHRHEAAPIPFVLKLPCTIVLLIVARPSHSAYHITPFLVSKWPFRSREWQPTLLRSAPRRRRRRRPPRRPMRIPCLPRGPCGFVRT